MLLLLLVGLRNGSLSPGPGIIFSEIGSVSQSFWIGGAIVWNGLLMATAVGAFVFLSMYVESWGLHPCFSGGGEGGLLLLANFDFWEVDRWNR